MDEALLVEHIKWAEGFEEFPYRDSVEKLTIGYGRNLDDVGISRSEATFLLQNDIRGALKDARTLPYWNKLDSVRKLVVADLVFNMGLPKVLRFRKMNAALDLGDYTLAAHELKDSKYYTQTGRRAIKNHKAILTGIWDG